MEFNHRSFTSPNLETAINREPLIISPATSLTEAIALMEQVNKIG